MKPILYIIIPCYNEQDVLPVTSPMFLKKIEDLIAQKKISDHSKIMFVNDGSKDNSSAIAHEYQDKYPGTFRVIDKENGGHGSCCNVGLRYATGKYIRFLDSDDWFDATDFPKFMDLLTQIDCDLILTNYVEDYVYKKFSRNIQNTK